MNSHRLRLQTILPSLFIASAVVTLSCAEEEVVPHDPETTDPETTDPETTDPETTDPETTDPETTDPETTDPEIDHEVLRSELQRETDPEISSDEVLQLSASNRAFSVDLYHQLSESQEGNFFFSPFSVSMALAMTYGGARGETERQMAEALHFPDQDQLHRTFNWLDLELRSREEAPETSEPFHFNLINQVWAQTGYPFEEAFLDLLALSYDAGVYAVDFRADFEAARQEINAWVSGQTEDRIVDLLPERALNEHTRMVLVNAIYFMAAWETKFPVDETYESIFYTLDGETSAPMMHNFEPYRHIQAENHQILEMPYEGGDLSMVVILPDAGAFNDVASTLDAEALGSVLTDIEAAPREVGYVSLPQFSFRTPVQLKEIFNALGMTDAFVRGVADFTGMSPAEMEMHISNVYHQAFVAVDETGTEAAASTAVPMGGDGDGEPDYWSFSANRPFIFLIVDNPTKSVLFLGRVMDPS